MLNLLNTEDVTEWDNLSGLFSQAPAPIGIFKGRELRYAFVNDAYSEIFNNRNIIGKTVREAFPELKGQGFYEILENVYDTGISYVANETPALIDLKSNGVLTTRYYNLIYSPYKNNTGEIVGVMSFGHDVTTQVVARKKEQESDARFRNIVQQSTDAILILKGKDLVLDVANEALFKLWNIGEESIGRTFLEILPQMKDQVFVELLLDVYNNGTIHNGYETEAVFKRENGENESRFFNFIYQPYRESDDSISGVLVIATDVTEQVIAKRKFAQSQSNFRNMILQAPVAMCVLKGSDYVLEIANEPMNELWGRPGEDLSGKPVFEVMPELKGQGLEALLENVLITGDRFIANERPVEFVRKGKRVTTYLNFVYEAFREGDGRISGVIAVGTEVTEQVLARQKIEIAEENARLAIESAELGTYEIDLATNEMFSSPRFNSIVGKELKGIAYSEIASIIHPDDLDIRSGALEKALSTGNLDYEVRVLVEANAIRWVRVKGKTLYNPEGKPQRLIGIIQDTTEQKLFAEELSKKVEERTRSLKEANERLERSNEELEQYAFISSHDLQEPLRKMQIYSGLVLEQPADEAKVIMYTQKIKAAAERLKGLIKDLLEYSRLSQKNVPFVQTDLNEIFQNILIDFEALIIQKKAVINADPLPTISAVPLQMNQLLYNLIGNALKFTKRDRLPVITIGSKRVSEERKRDFPQLVPGKEYVEINIKDNGIGFSKEYADKIFTIFQTLNEKSSFGGYGIGLAVCRKIITTHNGIIYADDSSNGASFVFILPCKQ